MAIKVNGTTVIDDNRNLVNIASGAGSSTTTGDIGTYAFLKMSSGSTAGVTSGSTYAGSGLVYYALMDSGFNSNHYRYSSGSSPSGTWRAMGTGSDGRFNHTASTLFVRIS